MINCILLTGGASCRFGSPKALAKIEGQTIIEKTLQTLLLSNINNIIIVVGADAESIRPFVLKHKRVKVVYNKHHNFGQTSSFKCGLSALPKETQGTFLLPIDFPSIKLETFNRLIHEFQNQNSWIFIPTFNQRKGHPPLFRMDLKQDFLALNNSQGINTVGHKYTDKTFLCPVDDEGILLTFNTPEEWAHIKQKTNRLK